jgi:hypothetical protein
VSVFSWLWVGWLAYFAVVEGVALYRSGKAKGRGAADPRDTFSEHVWFWFGVNTADIGIDSNANAWARIRRVVLGAFLLWLSIHFLAGGSYF